MFLDYFALGLLVLVVGILFYGLIAIHDIPHEIAKKRNHPHEDAIGVAGWISLFTLHVIWPLLWIWSMLYRPDRGWGINHPPTQPQADGIRELRDEVTLLRREVDELRSSRSKQ